MDADKINNLNDDELGSVTGGAGDVSIRIIHPDSVNQIRIRRKRT